MLLNELRRAAAEARSVLSRRAAAGNPFAKYRDEPEMFASEILGVTLTDRQAAIARSLLTPPYRCLVPSGNNLGKTHLAAAVTLWWFCTRGPAIVRTTAPKFDQVRDLLWKEIRRQARQAKRQLGLPFLPKACRIERSEDDYAVGTTATGEGGWKGHHGPNQLFIFDEATDVAEEFWSSTETMFQPPGHAWLAIFNPTDTSSKAYQEYSSATRGGASWHVTRLSALDHPNIAAELNGQPPPVPHAIRLATLERRIPKTCQLVAEESRKATDFEWPPRGATEYLKRTNQVPRLWRPGPEAEATLLGLFPSQGAYAVWGDGDWKAATREDLSPLPLDPDEIPEIGVDVARFGDDDSGFHARQGCSSTYHVQFNGLSVPETAGKAIEIARMLAHEWNDAQGKRAEAYRRDSISWKDIPIKVDDAGVGGGVTDMLAEAGATVAGINVQNTALDSERYPDKRSELWFNVAERAREGRLDLSRLDAETLEGLRAQAMAPTYKLTSDGRRQVEPKDKTKERLRHSPDGMDSLNLAYAPMLSPLGDVPTVISERRHPVRG